MEKILRFFLIAGLFSTPFYFFPSGTLQPSHIFFLIFSFFVYFKYMKFGLDRNSIQLFFPFYFYVLLVNLIYSIIYIDFGFLLYPIALSLNAIVFFCYITFSEKQL